MSDRDYDIDQEMLSDFIEESIEALSTIPGLFVEFEANPSELRLVEAVFRPIHSLKGNSAYFGLMKIKHLSHDMESVLDMLRKELVLPNREIINGLLAGVDTLLGILEQTRNGGEEVVDDARYETVHNRVKLLLQQDATQEPSEEDDKVNTWRAILSDIGALENLPNLPAEAMVLLRSLENHIWEVTPPDLSLVKDSEEPIAIDYVDKDLGDNPLEYLCSILAKSPEGMSHQEESELVLKLLGHLKVIATHEEAIKVLANSMDEYDLFVSRIGYDSMLKESLLEAAEALRPLQAWGEALSEPEAVVTPPSIEVEQEAKQAEASVVVSRPEASDQEKESQVARVSAKKEKDSGRTMRISEERVDVFLSYVGELIAVDEMLRYIHSEMVRRSSDMQISSSLLRIVNTFTKLSDDLQNSIMEIRKVSVRPMLQKTQRIVRDIASGSEKAIETVLLGEHVTIDRSLVESLEAPMVHMIRNAADHGIEPPNQRLANGKPERGTITVSVSETEEMIVLTIADDGKGLNYESIQTKAVKMGLIGRGAAVTEEVLKGVIFASGFSTAETVTDVSGRGVGMDAVKRSVEDAGGHINVKSEQGKGTEFRISLPKSVGTQILNSFVVQVAEERFVLPMEKISGSFKSESGFSRLPNGVVCVKRNNTILPVVSLKGPYVGCIETLCQGILVRIENKGNPFVFVVDTILGMQKVVLRSIPWLNADKFLGAAIMGDGRVSMIVDVEALGASLLSKEALTA